jgi:transposase
VLTVPPNVRVYLATQPTDMRKSFRGLSGLVRDRLCADPLSGHVFCFLNRRRTMLKLLVHVRTGYAIYYRRLSRGTFQLPPVREGQAQVAIDAATLMMMLEGIELRGVKRRLRHHHPVLGLGQS